MAKKKINGLPVFEARMTSENCGVLRVSFVDSPAVESDFLAYANKEQVASYKITDEDKQRVFGCVLRADYPIYRADENGEYYIVFKADEIRAFAQKYLAEGRQNEVDLEHDFKSIEGAEMVQYFIKDTEGGIAPAGFDDVADGSLFAEYQITDADLWERIKSGEFHGFSVEIIHAVLPAEYHSIKQNMKNTILARVKEALASAVAEVEAEMAETEKKEYKAISTDKGAMFWDGDDDLKAGDAVWGEDADGNRLDLEDGEYVVDGSIIVVADGKVSEIKAKELDEEEKPAEEADTEAGCKDEDEKKAKLEGEGEAAPEAEPEKPAEEEKPEDNIDDLKARIAELEKAVEDKDAKIAELEAKLAEPAGKPAHEAFKTAKKASFSVNNPFELVKQYTK